MKLTSAELKKYGALSEREIGYLSDLSLSEKEQKVLLQIVTRMDSHIGDSAKLVGYFYEMKIFGTLAFRIMHSHHLWIKSKKVFKQFDIDLEDLPEETAFGDRVLAVQIFKKDYPVVTDMWRALAGIKRRGVMKTQKILSSKDLTS